jgi:hypothetical protein
MSVHKSTLLKIFNSLSREERQEPVKEIQEEPDNHMYVQVPNQNKSIEFTKVQSIVICLYYVNIATGLYPFMLYLLRKNKAGIFSFITMPSFDGGKYNKHLIRDTISYMKTLFGTYDISYSGFAETAGKNIIIMQLKNQNQNHIHLSNIEYSWGTAFELFNTKQLGYQPVDENVVQLFFENPTFLFVKKASNMLPYEMPVIGYYKSIRQNNKDKDKDKDKDVTLMDIYRENKSPLLRKSYYLLKDMPPPDMPPPDMHPQDNKDEVIMRIAIFLGKMTFNVDEFNSTNNTGDGNYTSLFLNYMGDKYYIIKNYNQHVTLSFYT